MVGKNFGKIFFSSFSLSRIRFISYSEVGGMLINMAFSKC